MDVKIDKVLPGKIAMVDLEAGSCFMFCDVLWVKCKVSDVTALRLKPSCDRLMQSLAFSPKTGEIVDWSPGVLVTPMTACINAKLMKA